jgi:hypothetical protein
LRTIGVGVTLGLHTFGLGERGAEHTSAMLEEPLANVRGALLHAPELRLCRL